MLAISYSLGPDLPQGFQDSDGGIVDNTLITVGGFCTGQTDVPGKADKYPRGFLQKTWGLNLQSPQTGWQSLPDFPGMARSGAFLRRGQQSTLLLGRLQLHHSLLLQRRLSALEAKRQWTWNPLPSLPWPVISSGICTIGSKIYVVGGADYDGRRKLLHQLRPHRQREPARLATAGARHQQPWRGLAGVCGMSGHAAVRPGHGRRGREAIHVRRHRRQRQPDRELCTVVDNWAYDPATNAWQRLARSARGQRQFPLREHRVR